jgi:site-specific recombinase XerD
MLDDRHAQYSENSLKKAVNENRITQEDADNIKGFVMEISAIQKISPKRIFKYHYILVNWREFIGPFAEVSITDLYTAINSIQIAKKESGEPRFARNTLADYIRFIKRFYIWMQENNHTKLDLRKIQKIKPPAFNTMTKTVEMLLSEEQVRAMIEACQISRDRAIISMLYEGGFRIQELGTLRWNQVKFTDWNVTVNVDSKTGKPRYIPLVMARSYLAQWKNDYPYPITEDGYVFLTNGRHEQLQYHGIKKQILILAKRAGIEKHITPHIFRHSRITHLIQQKYPESVIKLMMWGDINSKMFHTYAHLTNADIDDAIAEKNGILPIDGRKKSTALEPRQCPRCFTVNAPTQGFCGTCGCELTEEAINKVKQAKEQGNLNLDDPVILEAVIAQLLQKQNKGSV